MPKFEPAEDDGDFFADRNFGGKRAALRQALARRDALFAKHGLVVAVAPARARRRDMDPLTPSGISYTFDRRRAGGVRLFWTTYWNEGSDAQSRRSWSAREHGFAGALQQAVEKREVMVQRSLEDEMIVQLALLVWLMARANGVEL